MTESKAKELGYKPKAFIRYRTPSSVSAISSLPSGIDWASLCDSKDSGKAKLKLSDIDVFEYHEAFAVSCSSKFVQSHNYILLPSVKMSQWPTIKRCPLSAEINDYIYYNTL